MCVTHGGSSWEAISDSYGGLIGPVQPAIWPRVGGVTTHPWAFMAPAHYILPPSPSLPPSHHQPTVPLPPPRLLSTPRPQLDPVFTHMHVLHQTLLQLKDTNSILF